MRYEVCVESAAGVQAALDAGADRVELCADLAVGGTTPSIGLIRWAAEQAAIDQADGSGGQSRLGVHVLIRPRDGDFVYSAAELEVMARDIEAAKAAGADGIVVGALTADGSVDRAACARLVALARPASVTFHRAFDEAADVDAAFPDVLGLGVDRLLTSGGAVTALAGADVLARLIRRAAGRLIILPGGGVTEVTAAEIVRRTGVSELHFSARSSPLPLAAAIRRIMAAAREAEAAGS